MKFKALTVVLSLALVGTAGARPQCPPDSVPVGPVCVDKYEASVWKVPASNTTVVKWIQQGKVVTLADLGNASPIGAAQANTNCTGSEYPATFPPNGNWTEPLYAVSIAGVVPSACVTWFQAEQACRLSGKRLLTNQEWQAAAAGTPDDQASCNIAGFAPAATGTTATCVSRWGAFDMVGNVLEWVGTWDEQAQASTTWPTSFGASYGGDASVIGGGSTGLPGGVQRGGFWDSGANAGVFDVEAGHPPSDMGNNTGFRCAR